MKSTGYVRRPDHLGRVVLPQKLRQQCDLAQPQTFVEIWVEDEYIYISKMESRCKVCGSSQEVAVYPSMEHFFICKDCVEKAKKMTAKMEP